MSSNLERKLAAIMFTDIVGYTALSAENENKALKVLDKQKEILTPIIEEFSGILHKQIGDGLLFTFQTVTDALKCGIKIQEEIKAIEDLNLRIGIHQGEITLKDGDALGDDINVASRIESYAAVGGIAISGKVQQDISSLPEFETKFISQPALKGVKQDIKIYCITSHNLPETDITKVTAKLEKDVKNLWFNQQYIIKGFFLLAIAIIGIYFLLSKENKVPSIAILMMDNLGTENEDFWARGITEDLIIKIAGSGIIRVPSIKEIQYIKADNSFDEIAKILKVDYILTSSIYKRENNFDLRCQLINVKSGNSILGNKWSEPIENAPKIVKKLTNNILGALNIESSKTSIEEKDTYTYNSQSYEYYLKGKNLYNNRKNIDDLNNANSLFMEAIEIDENLIPAMNALAISHIDRRDWKDSKVRQENLRFALEKAKLALKKSYEINNKYLISNSYYILGNVYLEYSSEHEKTIKNLQKALSLFENENNKYGVKKCLTALAVEYNNQSYRWQDKRDSILTKEYIEMALDTYLRAMDIAIILDDKMSIALNKHNIGSHYSSRKLDIDKSIQYELEALEIVQKYQKNSLNTNRPVIIAVIKMNLGGSYLDRGEYVKAEKYYNEALNLLLPLKDYDIQNSLMGLVKSKYFQSSYTEAIQYLEKALGFHYRGIPEDRLLGIHTLLYLSKQKSGEQYDINLIYDNLHRLSKDDYELNYLIFLITNDQFFIKQANSKLLSELKRCNSDTKQKFLNYPIPKKIVEEYNKIFKNK